MSIKTEIDRIKQSKADIISALTNKGVTVPSDASIDDLSALVDAISTSEDLSSELTTQNNLITTQETTIDNIISALQGKASGGSGGVTLVSTPYTGEETQLILNHGALPLASDVVYKAIVQNSSGEKIIEETLSFQYLGRPDDMYDHYAADNGGNISIEVIGNLSDGGANTGTEIFFDGFLITVDSTEATSVAICKL